MSEPQPLAASHPQPAHRARCGGAPFVGFPEPTMVLDPEGDLVDANEAARALGRRLGAPLDEATRIEPLLARARLVKGGGSPPWVPVSGGTTLDVLVSAADTPLEDGMFELGCVSRRDSDGRLAGWVVRLVDVAPLVAALRGRETAETQRDRLLKLMSHDLRTPLAAILATLKHPDLRDMPASLTEVVEKSARRALSMVDSNVRLIRAQCAAYRFVELDFQHIVEEAIDACWSLGKDAGVRIVLEPAVAERSILADRGYLTEALGDLFARLIEEGARGGGLACRFKADSSTDGPLVTLEIRVVGEGGGTGEPPEASRAPAAFAQGKTAVVEDGDPLDFFRTVVSRHSGATVFERESGVVRSISITVPGVGPARIEP